MSNYKETQQSGSVYTRASAVSIGNGLEKKSIQFNEEEIFIADNGDVLSKPVLSNLSEKLTQENMLTEFPIINPETDEDTGTTATYLSVQVALHSLYIFLAKRRDAAQDSEGE